MLERAGATGIITYFSISGGIIDRGLLSIRENDILSLNSEKGKGFKRRQPFFKN